MELLSSTNSFKQLLKWSKQNYSSLPWRKKRTLYSTLVSEIMLQQTTVGTVLNHFDRFLQQYPTLESLAQATEEEIVISWKGLGYYRRARNLLKAAKEINQEHKNRFPIERDNLMRIHGVGEYTASALISIGRNRPELAIDANIIRVLSRFFYLKNLKRSEAVKKLRSAFLESSEGINFLSNIGARDFNESLMDLGREICKANLVRCEQCCLKKQCLSFQKQDFLIEQVKENKISKFFILDLLRVVHFNPQKNKILAKQKNDKEWLSGQFELPTFIVESEDKKLQQYKNLSAIKLKQIKNLFKLKSGITKYKISNQVALTKIENDIKKSEKLVYLSLDDPRWSSFSVKVINKLNTL
ncbi:hypothetical protein N9N67_07230 [Bacteriovoracaceae bacterium]|nr:hypothetical protein [Bacteriovoracaceae bacterium]